MIVRGSHGNVHYLELFATLAYAIKAHRCCKILLRMTRVQRVLQLHTASLGFSRERYVLHAREQVFCISRREISDTRLYGLATVTTFIQRKDGCRVTRNHLNITRPFISLDLL